MSPTSRDRDLIDAAFRQVTAPSAETSFDSFADFAESLVMDSDEDHPSTGPASSAESDSGKSSISPGTKLHQYRILRKLGAGGMGEVYLATHQRFSSRLYAVKFLKAELVSGSTRNRFEAEINAMEHLQHPNIVYAQDAGEFADSSFLVMEYVDGCNLKQLIDRHFPMDPAAVADIVRQTAEGLGHAYQQGLVHRDIKPSNLMLDRSGKIKILDLGLARLRDRAGTQLTQSQQVMGTPDYMAPEQWKNTKDVDIRADIYSLGCTLYCLLTGRPPFGDEEHGSLPTKLSAHLNDPPPEIDPQVIADVPSELCDVMWQMLEKDPADRIQTPGEVVAALDSIMSATDLKRFTEDLQPIDVEAEITRSLDASLEETVTREGSGSTPSLNSAKGMPGETSTSPPPTSHRGTFLWMTVGLAALLLTVIGLVIWNPFHGADADTAGIDGTTQSDPSNSGGTDSDASKPDKNDATTGDSKTETPAEKASAGQPDEPPPTTPGQRDKFPIQATYLDRDRPDLDATDPAQLLLRRGLIGDKVFLARFKEFIKIDAKFDSPKFCYLFALNPTDDPKWKVQLCYPSNAVDAPARVESVQYPAGDGLFPLSDGVGQVALVLVTSDQPLPPFSEWKRDNLGVEFPWTAHRAGGVWISEQAQLKRLEPQRSVRGAPVDLNSDVLRKTWGWLRSRHQGDLHLIAFPVIDPQR